MAVCNAESKAEEAEAKGVVEEFRYWRKKELHRRDSKARIGLQQ